MRGGRDELQVLAKGAGMEPKVKAGGAAGAAALVLVFAAGQAGVSVPPEVASAVTVLLTTGAGWLKSSERRRYPRHPRKGS